MKNKKTNIIKEVLFYLTVLFLGFFIVSQTFMPNITFDLFGYRNFSVVSNSMEPEINIGDMVIVTKTTQEKLEVGDIITFYTYLPTNQRDGAGNTIYSREIVTHYLAEIVISNNQTVYETQPYGAQIGVFDEWVDQSGQPTDLVFTDIIGEVRLVIPKVGLVSTKIGSILANPILLILGIVNIIIIVIIVKMIKGMKKEVK